LLPGLLVPWHIICSLNFHQFIYRNYQQ